MRTVFRLIPILALFLTILSCSKQTEIPPLDSNASIPLSFAALGDIPQELKDRLIKKFPNITFTFQPLKVQGMDELISAGQTPDIVLDVDRLTVSPHLLPQIQFDLSALITTHSMNLDRFEPGLMSHIQAFGNNGQIYALPYERLFYGLFYNKGVFDKVHVPYPQDGMTWDETKELAARLSRTVDGAAYRGLDPLADNNGLVMLMDQYSLNVVDSKTDQAQLTNSGWKSMLQLLRGIYDTPGNAVDSQSIFNYKDFTETGKLAMALGLQLELLSKGTAAGQNIDLVTFPTLSKGSRVGPGSRTENLMITAACKHKDIAFHVLTYLVSDEVQLLNSQEGHGPTLHDESILQAFASQVPEAKDKNIQALYSNQLSPVSNFSSYEETALLAMFKTVPDLLNKDKDLDTVLRSANDSINQAVAAEKGKTLTN